MKNSFHRIVHWLQINIASSLGIRLQCVTKVHTLTPRENRERPESRIFKNLRKNTIFNEHPVHTYEIRHIDPTRHFTVERTNTNEYLANPFFPSLNDMDVFKTIGSKNPLYEPVCPFVGRLISLSVCLS